VVGPARRGEAQEALTRDNDIADAGFRDLRWRDYRVDAELVTHIPWASKYLGQPLLLIVEAEIVEAERPGSLRAAHPTDG
jgi:hypothetical protein